MPKEEVFKNHWVGWGYLWINFTLPQWPRTLNPNDGKSNLGGTQYKTTLCWKMHGKTSLLLRVEWNGESHTTSTNYRLLETPSITLQIRIRVGLRLSNRVNVHHMSCRSIHLSCFGMRGNEPGFLALNLWLTLYDGSRRWLGPLSITPLNMQSAM